MRARAEFASFVLSFCIVVVALATVLATPDKVSGWYSFGINEAKKIQNRQIFMGIEAALIIGYIINGCAVGKVPKRFQHYPEITGFVIFFIYYIAEIIMYFANPLESIYIARIVISALYLLLLLWSVGLRMCYGDGSLDPIKETSGDYGVGVKRVWTKTNSNQLLVFYPTDKAEYTKAMCDDKNKQPFDFENERFHSDLNRMFMAMGGEVVEEADAYYMLGDLTIDAWVNGPLLSKATCLTPIIINHGFGGNCSAYSGLGRELASHGYIVFVMDSHCGAQHWTVKENGQDVRFDPTKEFAKNDHVKAMSMVRCKENHTLIDEFHSCNWLSEKLGFPESVTLDLNKMIVAGQSFGGSATIFSACEDTTGRIKAICTLDAWLWPTITMDYKTWNVKVPFLNIYSENSFPQQPENFVHDPHVTIFEKAMVDAGNNAIENVTMLNQGHVNQLDMALVIPLELRMGGELGDLGWSMDVTARKYMVNAHLMMKFLKDKGFDSGLQNDAVITKKLAEMAHETRFCVPEKALANGSSVVVKPKDIEMGKTAA